MLRKTMHGSITIAVLILAMALLMGVLGAPAQARTESRFKDWGSTAAPDRVLRFSCHDYYYHYVVDPPTNDWAAETFLVDPTGDTLTSGALDSGSDPGRGRARFTICRPSTRPGKFKIRMKITYMDGFTKHEGWVAPSYFRLRKRA